MVSDSGRVRLGQTLSPLGTLDAAHVWDLARTPSGDLYAATGDMGKVFRREGKDQDAWTVVYDAKDTQALALAVLADGHVVVGTGPSGQVVDLTDPEHPARAPDRGVQYIWDLATDTKGNLFAATGPSGQLWRRTADGKWALLLDTRHTHLLCVAVGPDGAVYAGSDGEGLIYRVAPDGKASVVYDAPQSEVRTLRFGPDHALYAGTAAEAAGGGSGRGSVVFSSGDRGESIASGTAPAGAGGARSVEVQKKAEVTPSRSTAPGTPAGGSALPRPVTAGDNSVYRIDADGVPREIFRIKALIYALAWQGDRLIVGTGPEGQLYEVRNLGQESAPMARLDNGQVLALLEEPAGHLAGGHGRSRRGRPARARAQGTGEPRLRRPRYQAHQPLRRPVVAGRAAGGDVGRAAGTHRQYRRARHHMVGLVERTDRPSERPGEGAARPVRPVPRDAHDPQPGRHARASR